jgi:ankyrin repeat protein
MSTQEQSNAPRRAGKNNKNVTLSIKPHIIHTTPYQQQIDQNLSQYCGFNAYQQPFFSNDPIFEKGIEEHFRKKTSPGVLDHITDSFTNEVFELIRDNQNSFDQSLNKQIGMIQKIVNHLNIQIDDLKRNQNEFKKQNELLKQSQIDFENDKAKFEAEKSHFLLRNSRLIEDFKQNCKKHIDTYGDINTIDNNGFTPFHYACQHINTTPLLMFKYLVQKGANVNVLDKTSLTPLHHALSSIKEGYDVDIVNYLFSLPFDANIINQNTGSTLLHRACENINIIPLNIFKSIIEEGKCDINAINPDSSMTPINLAIINYRNEEEASKILQFLLKSPSVDFTQQNNLGQSIIHCLCSRINDIPHGIFEFLIKDKNISLSTLDNQNNSPLHLVYSSFREDADLGTLEYLSSGNEAIISTKNSMNQSCIDCIISPLTPLNTPRKTAHPQSLIKHVVEKDLLKYGTQTNEEYLKWLCATEHISIPSIKTFCESNQVNIDYNYLETSPLHKLLSNAKYDLPDSTLGELIEYFVEKGVPINSKDELKFETPLDLVSESTRPVIYQVLLSNGGKLGKYC